MVHYGTLDSLQIKGVTYRVVTDFV